ncbi:MAG: sigma 54-interacting transcriptional regulator [Helicobacteraceae bacterium]|jgi:DNA-binding NtrC family response regulator|nr:sigma 54-interacting transcriptional regulator [Helicobacteraceae bacterium]
MSELFLASEETSKEILRTATLIKPLSINVLIMGESGVGKSVLAQEILPGTAVLDGSSSEEINDILMRSDSLIVENFDRIGDQESLELEGKRIVATTRRTIDQSVTDKIFGVTLHLLPLRERPLDTELLAKSFLSKAQRTLMIDTDIDVNTIDYDLSENAHSLKRSVYSSLLFDSVGEKDLLILIERFLRKKFRDPEVEKGDLYRKFLYLYDRPTVVSGMAEYRSQLKLSNVLGLNRNTLRKKIYELGLKF